MEIKLQKQSFIEEIKRNLLTKVKNEQVLRPKVIPLKSQFSQEFRSKIVVEGQANVHLIPIVCQREGISISTFNDWTKEFIGDTELIKNKTVANEKHLSKDQRFKIVLEGKGGYTSIAEICRREGISQDVFLEWNDEFLKVRESKSLNQERNADVYLRNKLLVDGKAGHGVFQYLKNYVEFRNERNLVLLKSSSAKLDNNRKIDNLVVLEKINDIRYINKFFEKVNSKLDSDAVFLDVLKHMVSNNMFHVGSGFNVPPLSFEVGGMTTLEMVAARRPDKSCFRYLLTLPDVGTNHFCMREDGRMEKLVHFCAVAYSGSLLEDLEDLELLLNHPNTDVNARDGNGHAPLHLITGLNSAEEVVSKAKLLISAGADPHGELSFIELLREEINETEDVSDKKILSDFIKEIE